MAQQITKILDRLDRLVLALPGTFVTSPFEIFLALLCTLSGSILLAGAPAPNSIASLLPLVVVKMWAAFLAGGGLAAMFGAARNDNAAERFGLWLLATSATVYTAAILVAAPARGIVSAGITLAWALACFLRLYALTRLRTAQIRAAERVTNGS